MASAKVNLTVRASPEPIDRLRAAIAGVQAMGRKRVGLEPMIELGLVLAAQRLEAVYNDGERFPLDHAPLSTGRRPR